MSCNDCEKHKLELVTSDGSVYRNIGYSVVFLLFFGTAIYYLRVLDFFSFTASSEINAGVALLLGVTAGFSTCMAVVGGLVLAISARYAEKHPDATRYQLFTNQIVFNIGRVVMFGLFGGAIGYFGSFFAFSPIIMGALTLFVAIYLLYLGLQLTRISPRLTNFTINFPSAVSKYVQSESAFLLGGMTFFLPCGFTQAAQLAAIASGSFLTGAIIMAMFAIGTTPGLLVVGTISSSAKGKWSSAIYVFIGTLVILLSLLNIRNSMNLFGLDSLGKDKSAAVLTADGVQVVKMEVTDTGYSPNVFTVKKDIPVRWEIGVRDIRTCASFLLAPGITDYKVLRRGNNVIEFIPEESGTMGFSCSMGMYTGEFIVN